MEWINYREKYPENFNRSNCNELPLKYIIEISDSEKRRLKSFAENIMVSPYLQTEQSEFISKSKRMVDCFNPTTVRKIQKIMESDGMIHIKNLPVDSQLPNTPKTGGNLSNGFKKSFISESIIVALGNITDSELFNFRQEGLGSSPLIDNIVPIKSLQNQKGAGGFKNNFPFHSENAWHRKRPDYLVLFANRGNKDARTLLFSVSQINNKLVKDLNGKAYKNSFRLKAPDLYLQMKEIGIPLGTEEYSILPPINVNEGKMVLNINFNGTDCSSEENIDWLKKFEDFIESNHYSATLEKGSALLINNNITCHSRTGYEPFFNGKDRWLQRGYFKKNLWSYNLNNVDIDFEELRKMKLVNEKNELTEEFKKFIKRPELIKQYDNNSQSLIKKAMFLTPIKNNRIV